MLSNDVGSCHWLVEELVAARIVERERLEPYLAEFTAESPYVDADAFAKHLAREKILTRYQAQRALDGDAKRLVLGAYLLLAVMGNGSLGPVYLARGRADQKPYAVKVLPQRAWNVRLARNQVRAFQELPPHDSLAAFLDVGTAHGQHYFVWPFSEGRTLESIIPECGTLSPGEVARVGVQVAEVLKLCHARGLIHGLIKPSNVMIAGEGQARLLDYGIGALLAENADDDSLVDTVSRAEALANMLECAAPESVVDSSKWTAAGDQYSLGCTLYFTAVGRYPFPGGTFVDKMIAHQSKQPTPIRQLNPEIPRGLADVIDRLMQKVPRDRYRKLDEFIGELAPLATVSCVRQPVPVNVETPPPKGRLVLARPSAPSHTEPAVIELPNAEPKRGLLGRLFGGGTSVEEEALHATIVSAGPIQPGESMVLHIYLHGAAETGLLKEAARALPEPPRILATGQTRRTVAPGSRVGLHLSLTRATMAEPLQEFNRTRSLELRRFSLTLPADAPLQSLHGRLMIGQEGRQLGQVDFIVPVVGRS